MKFLHTSDWHVGRTLNGWSLLEEQEWAFQQIVDLAISEKVDGVIIAGDLYDRAVPPVDAIKLFNKTLARLVLEEQIPVYAISGNHDGAERLHFGRDFFQHQGLHLSTRLEEAFEPIELEDCQIFLLPFIDPIDARIYYKGDENKEIHKTASRETPIKSLSGGNQQKVIIGRWLLTNPDYLILDEPTRGIDIGTKTEIQKLVLDLADQGMAVTFISSEVEEMLRTCSRMGVLRDGKKVGEISGDQLTQEGVMKAIAGGDSNE